MTDNDLNTTRAMHEAFRFFQTGKLQQAAQLYQQVLTVEPQQPDANHFLGIIACQTGKYDQGVQLICKAIEIQPANASFHNNLGNVLLVMGRLDEATSSYRKAISLKPDYTEAYINLGRILHRQGNLDEAVSKYRQAISLRPDLAVAYHDLGNALQDQGSFNEAIGCYQKAVLLKTDYAAAYNNLGILLQAQGNFEEAEKAFKQAVDIQPDNASLFNNYGNILQVLGNLDDAISNYRRAISLDPDFLKAYNNLGNALCKQGHWGRAIACYQRALIIKPNDAVTLNNLGNTYKEKGSLEDAVVNYQKALSIKPDFGQAHNNLGSSLQSLGKLTEAEDSFRQAVKFNPNSAEAHNNLGILLQSQGKYTAAKESFNRALSIKPNLAEAHSNLGSVFGDLCQFDEAVTSYRKALSVKQDYEKAHANLLFALNYFPDISQDEIFRESLKWDELHARNVLQSKPVFTHITLKDRRLRIGYVSGDFRTHSVAYFFEPLLMSHTREHVEVFCYSSVLAPDQVTHRLQSAADHWFSIVGKNDQMVAEQIRRDKIDILVDIAGHSANNRLLVFAHKPAPIQVTWLGYPNTTGMSTIDYRLTDEIADPEGRTDSLHSEELIRLKHGFLCYKANEDAPANAPLPSLEKGHITFGSFNNLAKTTLKVVNLWAEILHAVPDARLMLKARQLADEAVVERFQQAFADQGITVERLEFYGRLPTTQDHLELYSKVDIGLDPFPYNGTTTTCEAMWMGVPVVTMAGERHAGRVGASIMHHIGLPDLVAEDVDSYVDLAVSLANDWQKLGRLRAGLRERLRNSVLCDAGDFAESVEAAYLAMWQKYISEQG